MREHKLLLIIAALCAVVLAVMPPIAQPLAYHNFSDPRGWLGIPNFGDVVSNVPFAFVGLYGTWALARLKAPCPQFLTHEEWRAGMIACIGFFWSLSVRVTITGIRPTPRWYGTGCR